MANRKSMGVWVGVMVGVAIAAAIVMTVALDVDQTTRDVTTYEYVTTTTGLFEYDKTPQYIDYDLSKNYTGYYTSASDPYWGGVGTNGDGYYASETNVNRYPLNLEPTAVYDSTVNLANQGLSNAVNDLNVTFFGPNGQGTISMNPYPVENHINSAVTSGVYNATLSSLITALGISNYDYIDISCTSSSISDRILFTTQDDYTKRGTDSRVAYTLSENINTYSQYTPFYGTTVDTKIACLSCRINMITGSVTLYSTPTPQDGAFVKTLSSTSDCVIVFSGASGIVNVGGFGVNLDIDAEKIQPAQYLDISKGVRVSP